MPTPKLTSIESIIKYMTDELKIDPMIFNVQLNNGQNVRIRFHNDITAVAVDSLKDILRQHLPEYFSVEICTKGKLL